MGKTIEVSVDASEVLDNFTIEELLNECPVDEILNYIEDNGIELDVSDKYQRIIDIVRDNDKKHALQELESLFGGMYTGWEKV